MSEQTDALKREVIRTENNIKMLEKEIERLLKYKQKIQRRITEIEIEDND